MEKKVNGYSGIDYDVLLCAFLFFFFSFFRKQRFHATLSELYNEKVEVKKAANYDRERQACLEHLASVIMREVERENDTNDNDEYVKSGMDIVTLQVNVIFALD
jgi:hypothetical protein